MINKIGILTFHASHNYGSMLQAYALQTFLKMQGFEVKIINYRSFSQGEMYPKPKRSNVNEWLLNPRLFLMNRGKWEKYEKFINERYSLTRKCNRLSQIEEIVAEESFEAIITGGDQIWNMNCIDFSMAYYLPFATPNVRRISFSPSFGGLNVWKPQHYGTTIKNLLENYDYVSVREKASAVFLTDLLGKKIPNVADPALLLNGQDYEKMAGECPIVKDDYIFYYSPFTDDRVERFVYDYATLIGLKVVTSNDNVKGIKNCVHMNNSGPCEFLNLLKYSKLAMGKSMHLAVFSMLFHKPFYIVVRQQEDRIGGLLMSAGLRSRYIVVGSTNVSERYDEIDWEKVDFYISNERENAGWFLKNALSNN